MHYTDTPEGDKFLAAAAESVGDVDATGVPWLEEPIAEVVPVTQWGALAYDLAFDKIPEGDILEAYKISRTQLEQLKANEHFIQILKEKKQEIAHLGEDASFVVPFRMIAQQGISHFMERLTNPKTTNKDFLNLYKVAASYAQLEPKEEEQTGGGLNVTGQQITFQIHGVPGLQHLNGGEKVLDHQAQTPQIEDAQVVDDCLDMILEDL